MVVIALTLGLLPSSAALGALPTNSGPVVPADAGTGSGTLEGYRAEDTGQCDPNTGMLTGGTRWWSRYGFAQGQHDYYTGHYTLGGVDLASLSFCIEIQPVLNGLTQPPDEPVAWTGTDGVGVMERVCRYGCTLGAGVSYSEKLLLTSLTFDQFDDEGLSYQWRVSGRFQDADDPTVTGDFFLACGGTTLCPYGRGAILYSMVPDL